MFKIPDWGEDVPKSKENFTRNTKKIKPDKPATPDAKKSIPINKKHSLIKKPKAVVKQKLHNNVKSVQRKIHQNKPNFVKNERVEITRNSNNNTKDKIPNNNIKINGVPKMPRMHESKPNFVKNKTIEIPRNVNNNTNVATPNNKKRNRKHNKANFVENKMNIEPEENQSYNFLGFAQCSTKSKPKPEPEEPIEEGEMNLDLEDLDLEKADEVLLKVKKKKLNAQIEKEDQETILFGDTKKNRKKEKFRKVLENYRTTIKVDKNSSNLRTRMMEKLKAAQFRYLNEKLYTSTGVEAQQLFKSDPTAFQTYHEGYQLQVKKWPVNPLDIIVKRIKNMPKTHIIADLGCGEASLSRRVPHKVRSFDLVASAPGVETCDMAHTPLLSASVDVAVYCLALMGTDLTQYLVEANRILKEKGHLFIAEVESRFDNVEAFTKEVEKLGFKLKNLDKTHKVFFFMEFLKVREAPVKKNKLPALTLKPCLYKRR